MVEPLIKGMAECGFTECELWAPQIEPASTAGRGATPEERQKAREDLRRWRVETPLDHFQAIRKKFDAAGIRIWAFNYSPDVRFSDEEIDRGFVIAKALGAEIITASATIESAKKIAPFADKHRMVVAMHNHSNTKDPNEFATPRASPPPWRYRSIQSQPRHRTLHCGQLRRGGVSQGTSRSCHQSAHQGPQAGSG
jgi:hypothetical protein